MKMDLDDSVSEPEVTNICEELDDFHDLLLASQQQPEQEDSGRASDSQSRSSAGRVSE